MVKSKQDYTISLTYEEAKKICERLEYDASWDKAGSGYYTLKRFVNSVNNIVDGKSNN